MHSLILNAIKFTVRSDTMKMWFNWKVYLIRNRRLKKDRLSGALMFIINNLNSLPQIYIP